MAIYNVEKYINKSINSILAQTFKDFELICIDDGSTDSSGKVCDEYAQKDSRVKVFHKQNGGVASARQFGYDTMSGEFSIHCDPDDWTEPNMLSELYDNAIQNKADIVIADFYTNTDINQKKIEQKASKNGLECINQILSGRLHGSLWNKLIRNEFIKKYNINFIPGINYCEDELINLQILKHFPRISYLPKAFYHYYYRVNGLVNNDSKSKKRVEESYNLLELQANLLSGYNCSRGLLNRKIKLKYDQLSSILYSKSEFKNSHQVTFQDIFISNIILRHKIILMIAKIGFYYSATKLVLLEQRLAHFKQSLWEMTG